MPNILENLTLVDMFKSYGWKSHLLSCSFVGTDNKLAAGNVVFCSKLSVHRQLDENNDF